jgi:hypothetical protein
VYLPQPKSGRLQASAGGAAYLALAIFGITVAKTFAVDLLQLEGVYRISGFVVLAPVVLAASFLSAPEPEPVPPEPPPTDPFPPEHQPTPVPPSTSDRRS